VNDLKWLVNYARGFVSECQRMSYGLGAYIASPGKELKALAELADLMEHYFAAENSFIARVADERKTLPNSLERAKHIKAIALLRTQIDTIVTRGRDDGSG
jgi:hypothetical protein